MIQNWSDVFYASFQELWSGVITFLPQLIVAFLILILGWVLAVAVGKVIERMISAIKVDKALQSLGVEGPLARAGFRLNSGAFIGGLVRWFFIIIFLITSLEVMGLTQVNNFLREVVLAYLPNVIVAALILVMAAFIANTIQRLVIGSAKAAGVPSTSLLGGITKWAIWTFAILASLYQLGIAGVFAQTIFTGFVAMMAIAGGLAFGLGGKDAASRYVEKLKNDMKGE